MKRKLAIKRYAIIMLMVSMIFVLTHCASAQTSGGGAANVAEVTDHAEAPDKVNDPDENDAAMYVRYEGTTIHLEKGQGIRIESLSAALNGREAVEVVVICHGKEVVSFPADAESLYYIAEQAGDYSVAATDADGNMIDLTEYAGDAIVLEGKD